MNLMQNMPFPKNAFKLTLLGIFDFFIIYVRVGVRVEVRVGVRIGVRVGDG